MPRPPVPGDQHVVLLRGVCPRCGAYLGAGVGGGMAVTEPVRGRRLWLAVATCLCGCTWRIYWRPRRPVAPAAGEGRSVTDATIVRTARDRLRTAEGQHAQCVSRRRLALEAVRRAGARGPSGVEAAELLRARIAEGRAFLALLDARDALWRATRHGDDEEVVAP